MFGLDARGQVIVTELGFTRLYIITGSEMKRYLNLISVELYSNVVIDTSNKVNCHKTD